EDGIRDFHVTGVQTCALPIYADEEHPPQAGVFAREEVAQIVAVPGVVRAILQENPDLEDELGYFPIPGKKAGRPGAVFTGGSDLVIPAVTDQRKAAIAVVSDCIGTKWNTDLARTMNYVPN